MSRHSIDRIAALPNVSVYTGAEVIGLEGDQTGALQRDLPRPGSRKHPHLSAAHLFLFIYADPNGGWLAKRVAVDQGLRRHRRWLRPDGFIDAPLPLETSVAGVFAIGDVRAGSSKRVAAAVGEGAAVVAQIHAALAQP
jgi:thioredoxin reductase (NADPH)